MTRGGSLPGGREKLKAEVETVRRVTPETTSALRPIPDLLITQNVYLVPPRKT